MEIASGGAEDAGDLGSLAGRIQAGDAAAEAQLVERFGRGIRLIIQRSVSDSGAVEDLWQETFLLSIRKVRGGEVRDPARLAGFVAALARNLAIEHGRRKKPAAIDDAPEPAMEASQLNELIRQQRSRRVRQLLGEMPSERDREVLFCFYLSEEDKESICRRLGLSSLHFNRVLHRARERYKEIYQQAG